MAYIGMRNPKFWPISTPRVDGSAISYGSPVVIGPAVSANVTFDIADNPDYGDDVVIDNDNGVIHRYDLQLNELGSCAVGYPQKSDWKPRIFQDASTNRFYTMIGTWLNEIDMHTGKTTPKVKIDVDLFNKVSLWNNHLYVLKRQHTSSGKLRSYIERINMYSSL